MYDYSELRGRIYARYRTQTRFARALGISPGALTQKLDDVRPFTAPEIEKVMTLLEIPKEKIYEFFFIHKGDKL